MTSSSKGPYKDFFKVLSTAFGSACHTVLFFIHGSFNSIGFSIHGSPEPPPGPPGHIQDLQEHLQDIQEHLQDDF